MNSPGSSSVLSNQDSDTHDLCTAFARRPRSTRPPPSTLPHRPTTSTALSTSSSTTSTSSSPSISGRERRAHRRARSATGRVRGRGRPRRSRPRRDGGHAGEGHVGGARPAPGEGAENRDAAQEPRRGARQAASGACASCECASRLHLGPLTPADHPVCQFCVCQPTFKLHESVEFT